MDRGAHGTPVGRQPRHHPGCPGRGGAIYHAGFAYKKAGVMLMDIRPVGSDQHDLFAPLPDPRRTALMAALERVNREFGRGALRLASEALQPGWAMPQEKRSPRWTTCWDELPTAR